MGLRISTNVPAMQVERELNNTTHEQSKIYERLASGNRINVAADDAAGLALGENLKAEIRSTAQAARNTNDGISLVQTVEGSMNEIGNMLIRLRELSIQAATDTMGDRERQMIDQETQSIVAEVNRIANVTTFNGVPILNGQADKSKLDFQVGIHNTDADRISLDVRDFDVRPDRLGFDGISSGTIDDARNSLAKIDEGIHRLSSVRAKIGAMESKLNSTSNTLGITQENLSQAKSRITDTDVAQEAGALVQKNILQQAGAAVLAQANSSPMVALKLL